MRLLLFIAVEIIAQAGSTLTLSSDGLTVYDSVNGITWLANANLGASNRFGLPACTGTNVGVQTCVNPSGSMNYGAAAAWVAAMNAANYLGHSNWQLPTTPLNDNNCGKTGPNGQNFGYGCTAGAHSAMCSRTCIARNRSRPLCPFAAAQADAAASISTAMTFRKYPNPPRRN
jgi:hypothetical protein